MVLILRKFLCSLFHHSIEVFGVLLGAEKFKKLHVYDFSVKLEHPSLIDKPLGGLHNLVCMLLVTHQPLI